MKQPKYILHGKVHSETVFSEHTYDQTSIELPDLLMINTYILGEILAFLLLLIKNKTSTEVSIPSLLFFMLVIG